jgi:hypothetical protein
VFLIPQKKASNLPPVPTEQAEQQLPSDPTDTSELGVEGDQGGINRGVRTDERKERERELRVVM